MESRTGGAAPVSKTAVLRSQVVSPAKVVEHNQRYSLRSRRPPPSTTSATAPNVQVILEKRNVHEVLAPDSSPQAVLEKPEVVRRGMLRKLSRLGTQRLEAAEPQLGEVVVPPASSRASTSTNPATSTSFKNTSSAQSGGNPSNLTKAQTAIIKPVQEVPKESHSILNDQAGKEVARAANLAVESNLSSPLNII